MGQQYNAKKVLTQIGKDIDEAPGQSLSNLLSDKWMQENGDKLAPIGDPAKIREQLIGRASSNIKDGDRQMQAFVQQKTQQDWDTLMSMHLKGQAPSQQMLDNMPTLPTSYKRIFRPDYRPSPVGDPAAFAIFKEEARGVNSPAGARSFMAGVIGSRSLNPTQQRVINDLVGAAVANSNTEAGSAIRSAEEHIVQRLNPTGDYDTAVPKKFQPDVMANEIYTGVALRHFRAISVKTDTPDVTAKKEQESIDFANKQRAEDEKKQNPPAAKGAPGAAPTPKVPTLPGMSDGDKVNALKRAYPNG
jgi:hypothetical protein